MSILGFDLQAKTVNGYTKLNPFTTPAQVKGLEAGKLYGPYTITLNRQNWNLVNNLIATQIVDLAEVTEDDVVMVSKILSGNTEEAIQQNKIYEGLDTYRGVESLQGQLKFTTTAVQYSTDINVQVWWIR